MRKALLLGGISALCLAAASMIAHGHRAAQAAGPASAPQVRSSAAPIFVAPAQRPLLPERPIARPIAQPIAPPTTRELAERGAPLSPFVHDASDRFAYRAVGATDEERRLANDVADRARADIDRAIEQSSRGTLEKPEAVRQIQEAYARRDQELARILGEDRALVLRELRVVDGIEAPVDQDDD